ncbi:MAG: hypothetical protein RLY21_1525 [Planctomycetota bacterium]|jgi:hypothetical protein
MINLRFSRTAVASVVAACAATALTFEATCYAVSLDAGSVMGPPAAVGIQLESTEQAGVVVDDGISASIAWRDDVYGALFGQTSDEGTIQLQGFSGESSVFIASFNGVGLVANIEILDEGFQYGNLRVYPAFGSLHSGTANAETYILILESTVAEGVSIALPYTEEGLDTALAFVADPDAPANGAGGAAQGGAPNGAMGDQVDCNALHPGNDCDSTLRREICQCDEDFGDALADALEDRRLARKDCQTALERDLLNCRIEGGIELAACVFGSWIPGVGQAELAICLVLVGGIRLNCGRHAIATFDACMATAQRNFVIAETRAVEARRDCVRQAEANHRRCRGAAQPPRPPVGQPIPPMP